MVDLVDFTKADIINVGIKRLLGDTIIKNMFEDAMNDLSVQIRAGDMETYKTFTEIFSNPYYAYKMRDLDQDDYKDKFRFLLKLKGFYINEKDKITFKV